MRDPKSKMKWTQRIKQSMMLRWHLMHKRTKMNWLLRKLRTQRNKLNLRLRTRRKRLMLLMKRLSIRHN